MNASIRTHRAFPEAQPKGYQDNRGDAPGMNLRQYYAGQAMQGLLAGGGRYQVNDLAEQAVKAADALCEELAK